MRWNNKSLIQWPSKLESKLFWYQYEDLILTLGLVQSLIVQKPSSVKLFARSNSFFNNRLEKGQNVEENRNNLIKAAQKFINEIVISAER